MASLSQDKIRGDIYDMNVKELEDNIKKNKDLGFLESYEPNADNFRHSGFTCRQGVTVKPAEYNSIRARQPKIGFGDHKWKEEMSKRIQTQREENPSNLAGCNQMTLKEIMKTDPRKTAAIYVKKACDEYQKNLQPYDALEENRIFSSRVNTQTEGEVLSPRVLETEETCEGFQIQLEPATSQQTRQSQRLPEKVEPAVSKQQEALHLKNLKGLKGSAGLSERPTTATATRCSSGGLRRPFSGISTGRLTSARTVKDPNFKRQQAARNGLQPFEFEAPQESAVEIRCMLHSEIPRRWKLPSDPWCPGLLTRNQELRDRIGNPGRTQRIMPPQQFYKSKVFQYCEEDVQEARTKPIVRLGGDYIEPARKAAQEQLEEDKKIIHSRTVYDPVLRREKEVKLPFYTLFNQKDKEKARAELGSAGDASAGEYRPASAHKFRENRPGKWVAGRNFRLY